MTLALAHARAMTIELIRYPAYAVPTLLLPSTFFLFFVSPGSPEADTARMATFAGFAVIGVAFFQFGVGIAIDRASPWETFLRTLPVGPLTRLGARVLSAAVFAALSAGLLIGTALVSTHPKVSTLGWISLGVMLILGTVPFAFLGIALGYWAPVRGALPIANLLYLVLAYAGGLWIRPEQLPGVVVSVSRFLPTRAFADSLVFSSFRGEPPWRESVALAGFSLVFVIAAIAGFRRDEGRRFS